MNDRINKKTEEALLRALENAKAFGQHMQENREKRLWKKVKLPCSLNDAIYGLTKDEIDKIRKNYSIKNISSLNKPEMAAELARLVPSQFKEVIYSLDQSRYTLIKTIIKNSGVLPDMGLSTSKIESLTEYSIIFPGIYEDQKVLFMPNELIDAFQQIDSIVLENIVQRNTEWIQLAHGMLYYYGVMEVGPMIKRIKEFTGHEVDLQEFHSVMTFACSFYGQTSLTSHGFKEERVFDAEKISREHSMRPNVDFYPFSKKQLLKAGDPDYIDKTPEMNNFISLLQEHYELSEQETNEISSQIINMINADSRPTMIIEYLQSWFEFPSTEFVQMIAAEIMVLYNNTRQWVLKGHTSNELFQEENKHLNPFLKEPFQVNQENPKVVEISTRNKVGRNDPCPCGSGKKYKKCCGK